MAIPTGVTSCSERETIGQPCPPTSEPDDTYTDGQRQCPLLPLLACGPDKLGNATAERETFKELVENDRDEDRDPLVASGSPERDANHDRVEDDAGFKDQDVEVSLSRRIVGGNLARRPMAVSEVALGMDKLLLAFDEGDQSRDPESFD